MYSTVTLHGKSQQKRLYKVVEAKTKQTLTDFKEKKPYRIVVNERMKMNRKRQNETLRIREKERFSRKV